MIKILHMLNCSLVFLLSSCPLSFVVELLIWLETLQLKRQKKKSFSFSNSLNKTNGPISCLSICQTLLFQPIKMCQNLLLKLYLSVEQSNTARPRVGVAKSFCRNRQRCEWMNEWARVKRKTSERQRRQKRVSWLAREAAAVSGSAAQSFCK